ncbi:MAG: hypothetical protein DMG12_28060 [Acidobacteria bacterium]|nr:MAG: hypothetical protein DMG12_28060 [Acidobacteriota bacterium]
MTVLLFGLILAVLVVLGIVLGLPRRLPFGAPPIHLSDLWSWRGTVGRRTYFFVGVIGFAIKHNIDRIVAARIFGRPFTIFNYWIPPVDVIRPQSLSSTDTRFLVTLLAIALPFVWVGIVLTVRRLRSARLPLWLVFLFFLPVLNLGFFALLSIIPPRDRVTSLHTSRSAFASLIPREPLGSAAVPFCMGLSSVLVYGYHHPRNLSSCLFVSFLSVALAAVALLAFAVEGLICIAMAVPIATPLALFGGVVGFLAQRQGSISTEAPSMMLVLVIVPMSLMGFERISPLEAPRFSVSTSIRIEAPARRVWNNLVSFPDLEQADEMLFRLGVSHPIRADIDGDGVGAVRRCLFTTGTFIENVNVWEEGKRLGFSIVSGPEAMREFSPYAIHPRHLSGYFIPESAQFQLVPNPDGSTGLQGTSWYRNSMWPSPYWRIWSDMIIHQVHRSVFEHIRTLSEQRDDR